MNIRYLVALAATGIVIGLLSSFGIVGERWELGAWLIAGVLWVVLGNRWLDTDIFRHVALGGAIAGFLAADVKILLWDQYVKHHPQVQQFLDEQGSTAAPRTSILLSGVVTGLIFGAVLGGPMAWSRSRRTDAQQMMESREEE